MQQVFSTIGNTWKGGKVGKGIIGCAALLALCAVCSFVVYLYNLTPQGRALSASETATVIVQVAAAQTQAAQSTATPQPTNTAAPTATIAPTDTPEPTNTPRPTQPPSPTSKPVPTAKPVTAAPTKPPAPAVRTFGQGQWIVGADIAPGTYRAPGSDACYWERLSGFGGSLGEILANDIAAGPVLVTIAPTDKGFNSHDCGEWTSDLSPITASPNDPFGAGEFLVGKDIAPGTWRAPGSDSCYWQRLRGFSGNLSDIIANDNVNGSAVVQIGTGDKGFQSHDCGTWTKVQ